MNATSWRVCTVAALFCLALVITGILAWIVGWVVRDLVSERLAAMRRMVGEARTAGAVRRV